MKALRANLADGDVQFEDVSESWKPFGGRALVTRFFLDEVPATCDPLCPYNKLNWAPGLLVGYMLFSVDYISARGGLGAMMGAKHLEAIVFN